jgi:RND superfamily putative drug exporter
MGRWSANHWKTATFGWLAFVVIAVVLGGVVGTKELSDAGGMNGESAHAQRMIDSAQFRGGAQETVLVQDSELTADDAAFRRAVAAVVTAAEALPNVGHVESPYGAGNEQMISADGHSALVWVNLRENVDEPYGGVQAVRDAIADVARDHPDLRIDETGDASLDAATDATSAKDFHRAEWSALPISIAVLLIAFGALLAALLPVVLAMTAFLGATGLLAFASQAIPIDSDAGSVMLLIGLAVGVDYSLFYLKREREERSAGLSRSAALNAAAATSGHSVLISGLTVMIAMAGMGFAGNQTFIGIALGTIIVVAMAVLGSLTVLPALLSRLGDKVERGRIPGLGRVRDGQGSRVWSAVLSAVLRRPKTYAAVAGIALLALAAPVLGLRTAAPDATDLPQGEAAVQTTMRVNEAFPGEPSPAEVVVRASDVTAAEIRAAARTLEQEVLAQGVGHAPFQVDVNPSKTVAVVSVPLAGKGIGDPRSEKALATLRDMAQDAFSGTGAEVAVGGDIAASADFNATLHTHMPIVFAFVLGLAFLLLLVSFRAPVIALTAIGLNLLSVGAAYGLLVIVFQHGFGEGILGFHSAGTITSWMPLFLFVVLFGLSMDYHVFMVSRIKEAYERGLGTREAIAHGISSTAGVVTAAACVMVFVFAVFATLGQLSLKELGVGLASAVLIDATVVRGVLLPATMALLGERNWIGLRRRRGSLLAASVLEPHASVPRPSFAPQPADSVDR